MQDLVLAVINRIIADGLATTKDVDIFKEYEPDSPDSCTMIHEYAGSHSLWYSEAGVRSIQVVTRAKNSQSAMTQAWNIFKKLKPTDAFATLGNQTCLIEMRNTPIRMKVDAKARIYYSFNMGITITIN